MANEPGITSTVRSEQIANPSSNAPFTPLLVGEADLESGMASANEIEAYQRPSMAKKHFGDSNLGRNVIDAIRNGASEVMAVATSQTEETFDLSSMSTSVEELPNAVKPDPEALSATVESSSVNVEITYEPLSEMALSSGGIYLNPSTREVGLSKIPTSGTLTYQAVDYTSALDEVRFSTEDLDFIGVLNEHSSVVDVAVGVAEQRTDEQSPCVTVAGLEPMSDTAEVTLSNDTSRLRRVAPGRTRDGASLVGAFVGEESSIGLTTTVINQRVVLQDRPMRSFDVSEREQLIEAQVTPLKTIGTSAVIVDDVMALSDDGEGAAAKGVTVYRDGSRSGQVKTTDATQEEDDETDRIEAQTLIELYEDDELTDTAMAELVDDHDIDLDDTDHQICLYCDEGVIRRQEGCNLCPVCGYSKC